MSDFGLIQSCLQRAQWQEAEAACRQMLNVVPTHANAWNLLSVAVRQQGRLTEAEAYARQAHALDPGSAANLVALGNVLFEQERWEDACTAYREALARDPQISIAWCNLGAAHHK